MGLLIASLDDLLKNPLPVLRRRKIAALGVIGDCGRVLECGNLEKIGRLMLPVRLRLWAAVIAGLLFAALAWQVRTDDSPLWQFDRSCAASMQEHAAENPGCLDFFKEITHAGGVPVMTAITLVGGLLLLLCGQRRLAALWLLAATLGCGVNLMAKTWVARERPGETLRDSAVTERNESYPSGHAMGSAIGYGSLVYVSLVLLRRRWAQVLLCGVLAGLVLVIGLSRIYLRAHWCSDVLGGFAIGLAWMAVCITLVEWGQIASESKDDERLPGLPVIPAGETIVQAVRKK
jgi:membrane-associated phospholipid phosphatase